MADWKFLSELASELDASARHDLPEGTSTALSDRIIAALGRDDRLGLEEAQAALEEFYLSRLSASPASAASAARDGSTGTDEEAAFNLGIIGFAHAIIARAASRRIDDAFERRLRSTQFEQYVRHLIDTELSGRELAERLGKDEAEVSRRLKVLRQMGAVECRREGNRVVNFLTPAARAVARTRNMGPLASSHLTPEVLGALDGHRQELPEQLRNAKVLVATGGWRRR